MPQCSVSYCHAEGGHHFPNDPELLKRWVVATKGDETGKRGQLWKPGTSARVCRSHYMESDYKNLTYYGEYDAPEIL